MYAGRTIAVNGYCTWRAMVVILAIVHHAYMAKPRHFLREWREHKGLALEAAAERLVLLSQERADADPEMRPLTMTHATLSRIERGLIPYNQYLLEYLADMYGTDPGSLIMRDPETSAAIWSIWDTLKPTQQNQVVEIAKTIQRTAA